MKYVAKNEELGTIGNKYHTSKRCSAVIGLKLIQAPDNLLKAYGISEMCNICKQIEERDKLKLKDQFSSNKLEGLVSGASVVVGKHLKRSLLRTLCIEYGISFTMRTRKVNLAKPVCRYWLRNNKIEDLRMVLQEAYAHWKYKIDSGDKHKPTYYSIMLEKSEHALKLLSGAIELVMEEKTN